MIAVQHCELPQEALLNKYRQQGAYTDCYFVDLPGAVTQSAYVEAFCTSQLFKIERMILSLLVSRPSSDGQASFGFAFHALLGFHRLYSRALLRSASSRLVRPKPDNSDSIPSQ